MELTWDEYEEELRAEGAITPLQTTRADRTDSLFIKRLRNPGNEFVGWSPHSYPVDEGQKALREQLFPKPAPVERKHRRSSIVICGADWGTPCVYYLDACGENRAEWNVMARFERKLAFDEPYTAVSLHLASQLERLLRGIFYDVLPAQLEWLVENSSPQSTLWKVITERRRATLGVLREIVSVLQRRLKARDVGASEFLHLRLHQVPPSVPSGALARDMQVLGKWRNSLAHGADAVWGRANHRQACEQLLGASLVNNWLQSEPSETPVTSVIVQRALKRVALGEPVLTSCLQAHGARKTGQRARSRKATVIIL